MKRLFGKKTEHPQANYSAVLDLDAGQTDLTPGLQNLYSPQASTQTRIRDIADVLLEDELLSAEQLDTIRNQQRENGSDLENLLTEQGFDTEQLLRAKAKLYGYEFRTITPEQIDHKAFSLMDIKAIRENMVMPIKTTEDGALLVATTQPSNVFAIARVPGVM